MAVTFVRGFALALGLCLVASSAFAGTRWEHPWLPDRMFDYRHSDWAGGDPLSWFGYHYRKAEATYEHLPDGSSRFTWDAVIDIHDPQTLPELLELDSLGSAINTKVEEFTATFTAGGETHHLDQRRLVERSAQQHAMYFDGSTVLSLIPPRNQPGRLVIHLQTFSEPHEGFEDYFGGVQFIQLGVACERRVLRLRLPANERLVFETRFVDVEPKQRVRGGVREYTFTFRELLPMFPQEDMPPSMDAYPSVIYSNQESWEELGTMVASAWEPHLDSTPEIDAWAAELTDRHSDWRDKALAIHDAVADGWGYLGFYPGESGWVPHAAEVCYSARLGDCKDRTALMVVMMRAVGVPAAPAIIWSGQAFRTPAVPVIVANHAIVQAGDPADPLFLDSVDAGIGAGRLRDTLSARDALVLGEPARLMRVPDADREHWRQEDEAYVSVQPDGSASIFLVRHWYGQEANGRKALEAGSNRIWWERALRQRLRKEYPQATIEAITQGPHPEDDQVWRMEVTLTSKDFVQRLGDYGVVTPPWMVRWAGFTADADRLHPRVVPGTWHKSSVRLFLPAGFEVVRAPKGEAVAGGKHLASRFVVTERTGELALELDVETKPGRLKSDQDEERSRFFAQLETWQDQAVVVRFPGSPPHADEASE